MNNTNAARIANGATIVGSFFSSSDIYPPINRSARNIMTNMTVLANIGPRVRFRSWIGANLHMI